MHKPMTIIYTTLFVLIGALLTIPCALAADFEFASIDTITMPSAFSNTTVADTFVVRNIGTQNLTNVTFQHAINSEYHLTFSPAQISSLHPNQGQTITVSLKTRSNEKPGTNTVGTVTVHADEASESFDIRSNITSRLQVSSVDVNVDDESDSDVEEGDTVEDNAKPGSEIRMGIEVENNYASRDDIRIEDVKMTVTIKDLDDGRDVDFDVNKFDIDANDEELKFIEFTIPVEVEEKTFDILIEVDGEDENNIVHRDEYTIKLKVDKKSHEVAITDVDVNPASCGEQGSISVQVQNLGANTERDARIQVTNKELGISLKQDKIELDEDPFSKDNSYTKTFTFKVPSPATPGEHMLNVTAYFTTFLDDQKVVTLQVNCNSAPTTTTIAGNVDEETSEDNTDVLVNDEESASQVDDKQNDEEVSEGSSQNDAASGEEETSTTISSASSTRPVPETQAKISPKDFLESKQYMIALTVLIVVILIGIIGMASSYFSKQ